MHVKLIGLLALVSLVSVAIAQDENPALDDIEPAVDLSAQTRDAMPAAESEAVTLPVDVQRTEGTAGVMDQLDLDRTEITGNQELPKVLYIVPWQKSDPGDLMGKPVNTLLDEVLAPIDRGEFVRQIRYYDDLQKD